MRKKSFLSLILVVLVSLLAACGGEDEATEENNADQQEEETTESAEETEGTEGEAATEAPEPDLEGVPEVVAEVNGEEILKEEFESAYVGQFQQAAMQSQMSGQQLDQDQLKTQIAESLIGQKLLIQEADNSGIEASKGDINDTLVELAEQNGLESKDEFLAALEEQGMSEEEVMSQVSTQVKLDQLIANESGDIDPSEEELQQLYDQYKAQQEQMGGQDGEAAEVPSFDEMKPQLEQQVKSQKQNQAYQTLVEKLREDAEVTNHLS
ncbi:SurA N-terminal domain-containing protein [Aquibacillus rhizosphaerae]|uniref:peptidylprolyl isomerase n=1 Tax=Aquibacillus rhizosphaerae TaxID=3051431 RepID=A0ABT7L058_9BACI|nr:SurA N-terminal domain-containing protein [Aquibacillus sp. LR5S19]MDL4839193.1 SurA N-terminal domain-containing protein [Aquibacillus sp. LR5S19]